MERYHTKTLSHELGAPNGRSVVPRRLPPVPSLPSLRSSSSSSSSSSSPSASPAESISPSTSGSSSPALSSGSLSPNNSPVQTLTALKRASRPLPQIPVPRHDSSSSQSKTRGPSRGGQMIICRSCMTCITTSEDLLPPSSVPPGSRGFRGFSGQASLFTEVYNVTHSRARVQLMTTGAHTMQETLCINCSVCLGWKIVKGHERSERWKEGLWLLELENLWLANGSDIPDERMKEVPSPADYPGDAVDMVRAAREKGLGLKFGSDADDGGEGERRHPQGRGNGHHFRHHQHYYSKSHGGSCRRSVSAIHLPMAVAT